MEEYYKLPKYIRDKIRLADEGDLYACYAVGNFYSDGKTLKENSEKSNHYIKKVASLISDESLRLEEITLRNYRKFIEKKFIPSKKSTTVLIGNNGSGKSTILEAIAKNLQFLADNIRISNNNNYKFSETEVLYNARNGYSTLNCKISLNKKHSFSCVLVKNLEDIPRKVTSELEEFKSYAGMLQESTKILGDDMPYPLIAYYPVERSFTVKKEDLTKKQELSQRRTFLRKIEGLTKSFDGSTNFDIFFNWYKELDDILNEYKANNSISVSEIEELLASNVDKDNLSVALSKIFSNKENSSTSSVDKKVVSEKIEIVKDAIKKFIPDVKDIVIKRTPYLDMYVLKGDDYLSVFNLSQGEKSLLALVSDIARRLVTLNPNSLCPLEGKGIVLIDEIDLHLHPQWQQSIIQKLESTFPNIQFIVSTHSPLVLTTVTREQIKILDDSNVFELESPDVNPFGKESSEGLAIMNTSEIPPLQEDITYFIDMYSSLVKSGLEQSEDAKVLKSKIDSFGYTIDNSQLELWRFIAENFPKCE